MVCKILLELAKTEDLKQMTNVVMDGSPIEAIDKDFVANLPEKGISAISFENRISNLSCLFYL